MFTYTAKNYLSDTGRRLQVPNGEPEDIVFSCKLSSQRCEGLKSNKQRCGRNTVRALPYCWQHYQKINKLIIAKSKVKGGGFGIFACDPSIDNNAIVFYKNDIICQYNGDELTEAKLNKRYGSGGQTAVYTWQNPDNGLFVDSACRRYIGAFANDSKDSGKRSNAILTRKSPNIRDKSRINPLRYEPLPARIGCLVAKGNIKNGSEIYVNYGDEWWKGVLGKYKVHSDTTRVSNTSQVCKYK
jgi:hypothetical protein